MQLSDAERLMLAMLCEIHEASATKDGINSSLVKKALCSGNDWDDHRPQPPHAFGVRSDSSDARKPQIRLDDCRRAHFRGQGLKGAPSFNFAAPTPFP